VEQHLGVAGLGALVFVSDTLISPLPPDVVLVVIAKTELAADWRWLVPLGGALSALAGCVGFFIGRWLGERRRAVPRWIRGDRLNQALVTRYGRWAVVLGAMTPIPFSVTCWLAGMCNMRFSAFAPITLLRIPRFVVYYLAIAQADVVLRLFI
jgi:membrane protein YqaA with SNARE-associated domain